MGQSAFLGPQGVDEEPRPALLAMCTTSHAPSQAAISERTLKMYCYQFLDVVSAPASIYRNPFS